ncbi:MAG: hypothetical protein AB7P02_18090 [Alphaproteobacteria bacterium]
MRLLSILLVALALAIGAPAAAQQRPWTVFFEAIPATGIDLPRLAEAPYEDREVLADRVVAEIVPPVVTALGLDKQVGQIATRPGGWMLATEPSLQATVQGGEAPATRLAAGLGYVLRQSAVLAVDIGDEKGDTVYAMVALPSGRPDPATTQLFFLHAAGIERGLAGGYSTIAQGLLYLNLRDRAGRPYGGLDDTMFVDSLRQAADTFTPKLRVARSGRARVMLVANDWAASPGGSRYRVHLPSSVMTALDDAQKRHVAIVNEVAARFGWR